MSACCVCSSESPKYKCPGCRAKYCSVSCCKKHKDECSVKTQNCTVGGILPTFREVKHQPEEAELIAEDDESDRISQQKLKLLGESKELKDLLLNPHLRQLLMNLDNSDEKESSVKKCMQEPLFVEFADRCLRIVEPDEKENTCPD
ncbi:zinc finger HIT domain-containing protein 3 isoform X2 [Bombina bombina]|uniref:zinc finger HIT domain-containing protein 3 isoform X2 n=1 Tax=Bombina bombina TaxID=8345 RepID=UPI00235B0BB2|nr:zinc finger HIT domain-containing protein 3 isoform X2 [Bombina bombina]